MWEFKVRLRSVKDVQDFVGLATTMGFPVEVEDDRHRVNGGSFMEMFCLDFNQPLRVVAQCSEEELEALCNDARKFLVR